MNVNVSPRLNIHIIHTYIYRLCKYAVFGFEFGRRKKEEEDVQSHKDIVYGTAHANDGLHFYNRHTPIYGCERISTRN